MTVDPSEYEIDVIWQPNHDCYGHTFQVYRLHGDRHAPMMMGFWRELVRNSGASRYVSEKTALELGREATMSAALSELQERAVTNPGTKGVVSTTLVTPTYHEITEWQEALIRKAHEPTPAEAVLDEALVLLRAARGEAMTHELHDKISAFLADHEPPAMG